MIITKLIDILLTGACLRLGLRETNFLGFTSFSIVLALTIHSLSDLSIFFFYFKQKKIAFLISLAFGLGLLISDLIVISNNILNILLIL